MKARYGILAFVCATALLCASAFAAKPAVTQLTPWLLNGTPCGTQAECKQAAVAQAKATPGEVETVAGPTFAVSVPASGGSSGDAPCPNIGAMQPGDYYDANGNPVFADPCHAQQ